MEPNAHFADEESPGKLSSNQINCKISQECYGFEQINLFSSTVLDVLASHSGCFRSMCVLTVTGIKPLFNIMYNIINSKRIQVCKG